VDRNGILKKKFCRRDWAINVEKQRNANSTTRTLKKRTDFRGSMLLDPLGNCGGISPTAGCIERTVIASFHCEEFWFQCPHGQLAKCNLCPFSKPAAVQSRREEEREAEGEQLNRAVGPKTSDGTRCCDPILALIFLPF
jgi:hypothetical protein